MFYGSIPAIITPMKNGEVDERAFQDLVEWQIEEGSNAIVAVGTTGESPTLSHDEHNRVVELCVEAANKRVPVIAGTGSNNTIEAVEATKYAKKAGADAVLLVTPYYNKPNKEGLYQYFKAINNSAEVPMIIYNIPGRSIVDVDLETMVRIAGLTNIVGVKDATSDMQRVTHYRNHIGSDFVLLSGDDPTSLSYNAAGGHGCISVTANVAPKLCSKMHEYCRKGDYDSAREVHEKLMPLHNAMFPVDESSPAPAKYGASLLNRCSTEVRSPIMEIRDETKLLIRSAMEAAGIL